MLAAEKVMPLPANITCITSFLFSSFHCPNQARTLGSSRIL